MSVGKFLANHVSVTDDLQITGEYLLSLINGGSSLITNIEDLSGALNITGETLSLDIDTVSGEALASFTDLSHNLDQLDTKLTSSDKELEDKIITVSGDLISTGILLSSDIINTGQLLESEIDLISGALDATGQLWKAKSTWSVEP